jgi:MYXO-CTERM domain-containing protein
MKHIFRNSLIAFSAACALPAVADTITQWDFNAGTLSPSIGAGLAGGIGGVSTNYFSGSSTDPASSGNQAVSFSSFPAATVGNKTAGAEFKVSTVGFVDISISYDIRRSGTASMFERFQYSLNGTDFVDLSVFSSSDSSFPTRSVDLSSISGVGNNPDFAFRVVSEFQSTATGSGTAAYVPTSSASYGTSGTWRFDMVGVSGTSVSPVPEPSTAMLGLAGAGVLALRARRRN